MNCMNELSKSLRLSQQKKSEHRENMKRIEKKELEKTSENLNNSILALRKSVTTILLSLSALILIIITVLMVSVVYLNVKSQESKWHECKSYTVTKENKVFCLID
uniref:Uncharacterized protein n=1 Tax=Vibrio cholerae non-O1/non-O139 TaxID=156539 RepID=A0A220ISZ7_VIBCL|nr:hypothetical protein [Vibrio cholerae non-O1/non-O139]